MLDFRRAVGQEQSWDLENVSSLFCTAAISETPSRLREPAGKELEFRGIIKEGRTGRRATGEKGASILRHTSNGSCTPSNTTRGRDSALRSLREKSVA